VSTRKSLAKLRRRSRPKGNSIPNYRSEDLSTSICRLGPISFEDRKINARRMLEVT
jgi:hypothetical protein